MKIRTVTTNCFYLLLQQSLQLVGLLRYFIPNKRSAAIFTAFTVLFTQPVLVFAVDASVSSTLQTIEKLQENALAPAYIPFDPTSATDTARIPLPDRDEENNSLQSEKKRSFSQLSLDSKPNLKDKSARRFERIRPEKLAKKVYQSKEKLSFRIPNGKNQSFAVRLLKKETRTDVEVFITKIDDTVTESARVDVIPPLSLTPGRYILQVSDEKGVVQEEEFVWGVLALNPNKSMYLPFQEAKIAIAVLDERGEMVCDANVQLTVSTGTREFLLSTENGQIRVTEQCNKKTFSLMPDYETAFSTSELGVYTLTLQATTANGTYAIIDSIEVKDSVPFDIERISATRLYPEHTYPMLIDITAHKGFVGTITEVVPESFIITPLNQEAYPSRAVPDRIDVATPYAGTNVLGASTVSLGLPFQPRTDIAGVSTAVTPTPELQPDTLQSALPTVDVIASNSSLLQNQQSSTASANPLPLTLLQQQEATQAAQLPYNLSLGGFAITQGFGAFNTEPSLLEQYRRLNLLGHDGIDIALPVGTPVTSVDDGIVVLANTNGDYGQTVIVEHSWGRSYYGHMSSISTREKERVTKGAVLGLSGNTGELTTGPHLHFGMRLLGSDLNNGFRGKIDPAPYFGLNGQQKVIDHNTRHEKVKILTYNVVLRPGETFSIGYNYKTPPRSPYLYRVGPLRFFSNQTSPNQVISVEDLNRAVEFAEDSTLQLLPDTAPIPPEPAASPISAPEFVFQESRQWQLAIDGVYMGKQMRTVEYVLGDGTDNNSRSDNQLAYAGTSWNTTKGSAGTKTVILEGTNIHVVNAYIETDFLVINTSSRDVLYVDVRLDVGAGPNPGTDVRINEDFTEFVYESSGLSGYARTISTATSLFQWQNDTDWNTGVSVVAAVAVDMTSTQSRRFTNAKLVLTYESDFTTATQDETKTVRFALDSTNSTDTGTRTSSCAASSTCSFTYNANIPDATADADILDVWFEISAEVNSGSASTITPQINGGTAGPAYNWTETSTDNTSFLIRYLPPVGSPDFQRSTNQTLDITVGTVPLLLLGGELVVTYRYSSTAATQTETIRYFMNQDTAAPGTSAVNFSQPVTISNASPTIVDTWYKLYVPRTETNTLTVSGQIAATGVTSNAYATGGSNSIRSGRQPTIIYRLTSAAGAFTSSPTTFSGTTTWSSATGDAPIATELYVTFTFTRQATFEFSRSLEFGEGAAGNANNSTTTVDEILAKTYYLTLSDRANKTFLNAYLLSSAVRSDDTSITVGTVTIGVDNETTAITENSEEGTTTTAEAYTPTFLHQISNTVFSGGSTITWQKKALTARKVINQSDDIHFASSIVVTYQSRLGQETNPVHFLGKQIRTVEYVIGNGSDNDTRSDDQTVYAGDSWNTTKGSAGVKTLYLEGSNISVRNAYLEIKGKSVGNTTLQYIEATMDVEHSASAGQDVPVGVNFSNYFVEQSGLGTSYNVMADATSLFDQQTDAQWQNGVDVVASLTIDTGGSTTTLATIILKLTYEYDFSDLPTTAIKTVRFPLDSTANGGLDDSPDTGSKQNACAAATTCSFTYNANIPDAAADADVVDVWFQIHAQVDSPTASSLTPQINGGTAGTGFTWKDTFSDDINISVVYRPPVGSPDFQRSTSQTLDIVNGTVPLYMLGGEVVVTYRYQTNAASQTETVRYFMTQTTAANPGTTKTTFSQSVAVSNPGMSMQHLWYRVRSSPIAATNMTVFGTVGAASEKSDRYVYNGSNPRSGHNLLVYYDMSADVGSFSSSPTTVAGAVQFSDTDGALFMVELFATFTWNGEPTGSVTKSVSFGQPHQGGSDSGGRWSNSSMKVFLPETVTKTHRSSYLSNQYHHSDTTSITTGTVTSGVNQNTVTLNERADTTSESYILSYLTEISSTNFSGGATIPWTQRQFTVNHTNNQSDSAYYATEFIVTYDVQLSTMGNEENPTLSQLMRHGKWFNSFGVERAFTF